MRHKALQDEKYTSGNHWFLMEKPVVSCVETDGFRVMTFNQALSGVLQASSAILPMHLPSVIPSVILSVISSVIT